MQTPQVGKEIQQDQSVVVFCIFVMERALVLLQSVGFFQDFQLDIGYLTPILRP